jgi:predicted nucleotide-binding protein (sugar kinase/HSP70/actin superfamily)
MRIIGAIKRGQIPVASDKFGDHPAEDLALLFPEDLSELKSLVSTLAFEKNDYVNAAWEKLENYRKIADENNREIIRQLQEERNIAL